MNKIKFNLVNTLDSQYQDILRDLINHGTEKIDRTGTGTISIFGKQIRHSMWQGFPLLTTKKMAWKSIVTELLWFLKGETNIKYLLDNDCNIWTGDAYKRYKEYANSLEEPDMDVHIEDIDESKIRIMTENEFVYSIKNWEEFSKRWGELGPIYGKQWREWGTGWFEIDKDNSKYEVKTIDQIQNLIDDIKKDPDSRRLMVNAWNVGELNKMILPPCHYGFQIYTQKMPHHNRERMLRERMGETKYQSAVDDCVPFGGGLSEYYDSYKIPQRTISLMWNQRSVDTFLGLPFNIASYGLLLEIIANEVNMVPDQLIGNLGDVHLYKNHIDQAKEQLTRSSFELPKLKFSPIQSAHFEHHLDAFEDHIKESQPHQFIIEEYQSHPSIKAPLSN
jgi:thymidylate synthase